MIHPLSSAAPPQRQRALSPRRLRIIVGEQHPAFSGKIRQPSWLDLDTNRGSSISVMNFDNKKSALTRRIATFALAKLIGEVTPINGAHGTAIAESGGQGFATLGKDQSVVMFDSKTCKELGKIPAADDLDAIVYDAPSNRVFSLNGEANSSTVIDANRKRHDLETDNRDIFASNEDTPLQSR